MIQPPHKGDPYPGLLPPVRVQWLRLALVTRVALIAIPVVLVVVVLAANVKAGITAAVLILGVAAATFIFAKNRTDRHNAAVERGEIIAAPDPHFRPTNRDALDPDVLPRLDRIGYARSDLGQIARFDGGWLVKRRNSREVAVVLGDDGGCALFDPRTVTDLWAVTEYRAGRGREPETAGE